MSAERGLTYKKIRIGLATELLERVKASPQHLVAYLFSNSPPILFRAQVGSRFYMRSAPRTCAAGLNFCELLPFQCGTAPNPLSRHKPIVLAQTILIE